jgi:hypothetical protein
VTALTRQAVRQILLAAGYPEHACPADAPWVSGFHVGEGDTEVLVEYLRGPDSGAVWDDQAKAAELAELTRYVEALHAAGLFTDRAWGTHGDRMIVIPKRTVR